jgi:signal transduction histidine kinase
MRYDSLNENLEGSSDLNPLVDSPFRCADRRVEKSGAPSVSRSLIDAQERELSNIARELHDDICQRLAMLSFKIEKVAQTWAAGQVPIGDQLEHIWQQCNQLTGHVQALSHELHPSILDNLGLSTALKSLCREVSERSGAVIGFVANDVPRNLPRDVSLSIFRLVQEALHNSVKHSRGNQFCVRLRGEAGALRLEVCDHGVGFDVSGAARKVGLGLVSMQERVQLLDGTFEIESEPNAGTRIRAWIPLRVRSESSAGDAN